jgi:hypothetical protein
MPARKSKPPTTPDGRYLVVRGRLWRTTNPNLPASKREQLVSRLMRARSALRGANASDKARIRARIDKAKRALGERGKVWWKDGAPDFNRHLVKNTPYAAWFHKRSHAN